MKFSELNLSDPIQKAVAEAGYKKASPIQEQAIPVILEGKDVLASAQTGTGKTAAFVLPILEKLSEVTYSKRKPIRCLVLVPTRELCAQVSAAIKKYGKHLKSQIYSTEIFGGVKIESQIFKLRDGCDILVATPGRLRELLAQGLIKLNKVQYVVFDEADQMLNLGFEEDIRTIRKELPQEKQTLLFSATTSQDVKDLILHTLNNPVEVHVARENSSKEEIKQSYIIVYDPYKVAALKFLIEKRKWKQVLVFCNTRKVAESVARELKFLDIKAQALHGNKTQNERTAALKKFLEGKTQVLVATDVAGRGLDVPGLGVVVNYDVPIQPEDYVHRVGRTGRAGKGGIAISLVDAAEQDDLENIQALIRKRITRQKLQGFKQKNATEIAGVVTSKIKKTKNASGKRMKPEKFGPGFRGMKSKSTDGSGKKGNANSTRNSKSTARKSIKVVKKSVKGKR